MYARNCRMCDDRVFRAISHKNRRSPGPLSGRPTTRRPKSCHEAYALGEDIGKQTDDQVKRPVKRRACERARARAPEALGAQVLGAQGKVGQPFV